ncbi:ABC transporter permease [Pseudomonas sp. RIT-PI-AD]|uniref:ABC transporter permease n=1 Tax=Pseudomonas sp. RIT-PI-AD TaxID=3035294 RepID=UPI0021DA51FA|nr:ABC transporter permease [Pseudomonas sp. RIT-PI-AD]
MARSPNPPASLQLLRAEGADRLLVSGDWVLEHYVRLEAEVAALAGGLPEDSEVDLEALGRLDTAGAALLVRLLGERRALALDRLPPKKTALLRMVTQALHEPPPAGAHEHPDSRFALLEHIGVAMTEVWKGAVELLGFIGLTLQTLLASLLRPRRWRLTSVVAHLEQTGLDALPIVALLTFMVGAVVSFLGATVLQSFGASIFTVNLVAFAFLREFGVLLAAILIAGRTASAFTAQIGSMRANEEVDAIRTLGLDPVELLVLPRLLALLVALPILTFVAMLSGILGGLTVCALSLDISPGMFLGILHSDVEVRHFFVGLAKAPLFAFLIAVIGCLEGFKVSGSAQSVGEHTTSSVVKSIFVVILLDALAALFCMEMGW